MGSIPSFLLMSTVISVYIVMLNKDWVKTVHIRSFSGSCFSAFGLNTERKSINMGRKNSEYGHFSRS